MLYRDLIGLGHSLTSEYQDRLKMSLKNPSYSYVYSYDYSKQKRILTQEEWMALNDLRNDTSIIITKPDKGNGVVIVTRYDYLNKMKQLISDGTKFKLLSHNPTKSRENSLISYLRGLKRDCIMEPKGRDSRKQIVIFKKITTFFNLEDMFRCYKHHNLADEEPLCGNAE